MNKLPSFLAAFSTLALSGCLSTMPTIGDPGAKSAATGAAAGGHRENANSILETCPQSFGTAAVLEKDDPQMAAIRNADNPFVQIVAASMAAENGYRPAAQKALRLIMQQSNCFLIVERGAAYAQGIERERQLRQQGELRGNANMGKGQLVAADYTIMPEVLFKGTSRRGGILAGTLFGAVGSAFKSNEAQTTLTLIDNRTGVQIAIAEGSSSNMDFSVGALLFGGAAGGLGGMQADTPEGKVMIAAMTDSYNQMVRALRNYRQQTVNSPGGVGGGGRLTSP